MIRKSINKVCKEYWNIENYEEAVKDETQMWDCHHRTEISEDGKHTIYTAKDLAEKGLIFNRPAEELIFLSRREHLKLHHNTVELKKIKSEATKGEKHPLHGKHHSEETKMKLSELNRGKHHSEETKMKMSETRKGEGNGMYGRHHTEEARRKMSETKKIKKQNNM